MTAPPDFSQSSTPYRLLVPRHPPHALNSLATSPVPPLAPLRVERMQASLATCFGPTHAVRHASSLDDVLFPILRLVSNVLDKTSTHAFDGSPHLLHESRSSMRLRIHQVVKEPKPSKRPEASGSVTTNLSRGWLHRLRTPQAVVWLSLASRRRLYPRSVGRGCQSGFQDFFSAAS